jgi:hypothetical protein
MFVDMAAPHILTKLSDLAPRSNPGDYRLRGRSVRCLPSTEGYIVWVRVTLRWLPMSSDRQGIYQPDSILACKTIDCWGGELDCCGERLNSR